MKTIKYIGLDVHKNSISISTADEGRDSEVRYYGRIGNDMTQLMKVFRKFISKGFELSCHSFDLQASAEVNNLIT